MSAIQPSHRPPLEVAHARHEPKPTAKKAEAEALIEQALAALLKARSTKPRPAPQPDSDLARRLGEASDHIDKCFSDLFQPDTIEAVSKSDIATIYNYLDSNPFLSTDKEPSLWYKYFQSIERNVSELDADGLMKDLVGTVRNMITFIRSGTRLDDLHHEEAQKKYYGALYYTTMVFRFLETHPEIAQKVVKDL